jgi:TolB-like protein/Flp pilus assembly protein TadD
VVAAIAGLTALFASVWGHRARFDALGPRPALVRVVVLPFENLSGDSSQDFLSDGFTEETIARLGGMYADELGVIARTSSMSYKQARKRVDQIGRELNVDYALEGSLQATGERLRVTAQLIRTADETHVWANTYDRDARDVLEIQREIVAAVAQAIHARHATRYASAGAGSGRAFAERHHDPIAYEHYLKGRYLWNQRTGSSTRAALRHFQQAIDRQPGYALAYAGIADAYIILGSNAEMAIAESHHPRARAAALKALELDETLAEAHTSLAALLADYYWDWALAESHFRRSLALNPNDVTGHHWYSEYLMRVGRSHEAVREAEAAQRADPLSPIANVNLGYQLVRARRYDEGIARLRQTLELFPHFGPVHSALGLAYSHQGKPREALEHFQQFREIFGETPDSVGFLGFAHARSGDRRRARAALESLEGLATRQHVPATDRAIVFIGLDDRDAAFHWLERAVELRDWQMGYLATDPLYDSLRTDVRFGRLRARVGLP